MSNRNPVRPDASADLVALAARTPGAKVLGVSVKAGKRPGKVDVPPLPGVYRLEIPGWSPALLNELLGHHMKAARLKKRDLNQIATAKLIYGVPDASTRRRVNITISRNKGRIPDPDGPLKSVLDALKVSGLIVDDSDKWCLWSVPRFINGPKGTVIEIEDIGGDG